MFEGFARVWTPVALAEELSSGTTLAVEVAGTPVVLFRDAQGRAVGLVDRCPHRGVKLSLGRVREGCIECPFHGWQLEGDGSVRKVPWNPDARRSTLHGTAVPVRELAGQLWLWTDPFTQPTDEPTVHESLLAPGVRVSGFAVEWATHWTRAMENMLDWPHLPFIHRGTIGRQMAKTPDARMDITAEERPWGLHTHIAIDGVSEPTVLDLRWPNQMNLHLSDKPGRRSIMLVACVPVDDRRTRMLLTMARDFLTVRWLDWLFNSMNAKIASEDKLVVESSWPREVPAAGEEQSVRTDAPTLHFRKRYFAELQGSRAAPEGAGRRRALAVARS
jgi:phenylpropionate dioxygenase-like ring-hydroxylating dioxygenase large terminal subunit